MERVEDDVAFGLESRAWSRDAMLARVPEALDEVGLAGLERRRTSRLSGGQQQRLALAGALAPRPGILVLDEPTANLDPPAARAFAARMTALRAARAVTMVLVEHRIDIAWSLADRVLALGTDGRPIDFGAPAAVLARSRDRLLAAGAWLPDEPATSRRRSVPPASSHASDPVVVTASGVRYAYDGPDVIQGVDVAVAAGERTVLVGTNGSGKSTLGRLLVGLLRPSRGQVRLEGRDPSRLRPSDLAEHAAYLFQDPEQQFVTLRVEDEVTLGLDRVARRNAESLMDRIDLPLALFGDRSPYTLSGGEQRRLSLATALVRRPRLLVLDEPTFGQDRRGHEALLQILDERVDDGAAVLAATHDERFIDAFASRILRLEGGRIVAVGGPAEGDGSVSPATVGGQPATVGGRRPSAGQARPSAGQQRSAKTGRRPRDPAAHRTIRGPAGQRPGPREPVDQADRRALAARGAGAHPGDRAAAPGDGRRPRRGPPPWRHPGPAPAGRRRAAVAGGARHRPVQRPVLGLQLGPDPGGRRAHRTGADHLGRAGRGCGPGRAGDRHHSRRRRVRADDRLHQARGLARATGSRPGALRVWRAGRLPGDPAARRAPHVAAPGTTDPRPSGVVASAAPGRAARARHPTRGSPGARDGRPGIRLGPRSRYRLVRWSWLDPVLAIGAGLVLVVALAVGGG